MRLSAIIIGCGNIGALYDIDNRLNEITTYLNALSRIENIDLTICDINIQLLERLSSLYNCSIIKNTEQLNLKNYDIVCIALPTEFHLKTLKDAITAKVPMIFLEKPVVSSLEEIDEIKKMVGKSESFIIVNYYRRFQPSYIELKKKIAKDFFIKNLSNIVIKYNRGFYNNCSHAIDLLGWLLNIPYDFSSSMVISKIKDTFPLDPTSNLMFKWDDITVSCSGITNTNYYILDIELYFKNGYILILEGGDKVVINLNGKTIEQSMSLNYSMKFVIDNAVSFFNKKRLVTSNIDSSIKVLESMMKIHE